jgi:hypothetical protein
MRISTIFPGTVAVALCLFGNSYCRAQETSTCSVQISAPLQGDKVGPSGEIKGKASLPAGSFLWIFVHREGLQLWWPQGNGATKVKKSGDWKVSATFGDESNLDKDRSANFEIKALMVDQKADSELKEYVATTLSSGRYPGVQLPAPVDAACVSKDLTVERK